ncbi:hypothetical protein HUT17_05100 (plasmid) [Nocardiopsis flavescens]|nr:hypothetical protein HUT17_05100 [Nocardiopsis flavescens]
MASIGRAWVPQARHRRRYEASVGPGRAELGRSPAQAVAVAVAGGHTAAHAVFALALRSALRKYADGTYDDGAPAKEAVSTPGGAGPDPR